MNDSYQPEDIAAYNDNSLKALVRAITLSQGQFRLILVRCNYGALRERMVQRLRELSPVKIRELVLPESVKTLYTTIKTELGDEIPPALMVFGLESVSELKTVLTSSNYIREEFSNHFPFPLVLWVNDEAFKKLLRIAPDVASWATSVEFKLTTDELLDFLRQKTDEIFTGDSTPHLENCFEVEAACQDLQRQGQGLEPELEARLEFVRGLDDFRCDRIDQALAHYQKSLALSNLGLERQGILLVNIARSYYRNTELNRAESRESWEQSRNYFQQCLDAFEQAQRPDLVAKHINLLGEVLRRLKAWDELKSLAEKALALHRSHGNPRQLAQDYGFLAEVALEQSDWKEANQLAQQGLQRLPTIPNRKPNDWALYTFLVARSQQHLGQVQEAIANLEQVRQHFNPQYDPQLYIDSLWELRSLYFQQREYFKAFEIKQEQFQIEHQYGFRAFIGAGYLQPKRSSVNPAVGEVEQQGTIAQEIAVSSRQQDVKRLIERISRNDCKLTVIHGQSGVGKSSVLQGGLVPALHQQAIGERDVLPILLRVYKDWVGVLEAEISPPTLGGTGVQSPPESGDLGGEERQERIDSALHSSGLPPQPPLLRGEQYSDSPLLEGEGLGKRSILQQLRNNADRNLLTVLIFDQFEEFFFVYSDQAKRRPFYEFLRVCLDIPFVKVILSLREDYLHYLLELDRLFDLTAINNNILDKGIRYYLGNFSLEDARSVVQSLTRNSQFPLEAGLIEAFVQDLAGEVGEVRPIELQIVGMQLQTEKITTLEQYRQGWTKNKLVERFLEEVIKDCGFPNERAARLVLYLLTNDNGTRPLKTRAELVANLAAEADKLDLVLEVLINSGLVLLLPEKPENLYQLVHDYLVDFIRQQQGAELLAQLAELRRKEEQSQVKIEQLRLENELLEELAKEQQQRKLTEEELKRLEQANRILAEAQQKATRRIWRGSAVLLTSLVIAATAGILASQSWQKLQEIQEGTRLEQEAANAVRQFQSGKEIEALTLAIDSAKDLKKLVRDGRPLEDYPLTSPLLSLQTILDDIRQQNQFRAHQKGVNSVSFSPNGQRLVTTGDDKTARLWNLSGERLVEFKGHQGKVWSASFSRDSKLLATAGEDGTVRLWNLFGKELVKIKGHQKSVRSVSFSPDGKLLATAGEDGIIRLWNLKGQQIREFKGHRKGIMSISFNPDGQRLATAGQDSVARLWNLEGQLLQEFRGHRGKVRSVSFSPDGQRLATAGDEGIVQLWNLKGQPLQTFTGHQGWVRSVSFSPDGQRLATAGEDGTARLWNLTNGEQLAKFIGNLRAKRKWVLSVSFSPDGKQLVTGEQEGTTRLWNLKDQNLTKFAAHPDSKVIAIVSSLAFSPDGQRLATTAIEGEADKEKGPVRLWNLSGKQLVEFKGHPRGALSVSFSPNGQLLATAGADSIARLWNLSGKQLVEFKGHKDQVRSVSFSPNGRLLATASEDGTARLWNLEGQLLQEFKGHHGKVRSVRFHPDGQYLATAAESDSVRLWNLKGQQLAELKGHKDGSMSMSFSPDGQRLVAGGFDGTVRLWNLKGEQLQQFNSYQGWIMSVSFSPDGQRLATAGQDSSVRLWNLKGHQLAEFRGHQNRVWSVSFSPDGQHLASSSEDGTVRLWRVEGLDELLSRGCNWVRDYLKTNPNVSESDRHLCDDIPTQK